MAGLAFGTGVHIVGALWGECDWNDNDVDIDVERYNNINGNNRINVNQNKRGAQRRAPMAFPIAITEAASNTAANWTVPVSVSSSRTMPSAPRPRKRPHSMDRAGIERPPTSNREAP